MIHAIDTRRPWYNAVMSAERWITTAEAAEIAQYHPHYVRQLIREGKVKARRFGPLWQVDRESLLAYVRAMEERGERRGPKTD